MVCKSYPGFPGGSVLKTLPATQETQEMRVRFLGWEDPLEKEMATHTSILAWGILWTEEPGWPQSMDLASCPLPRLPLDLTSYTRSPTP